VNGCVTWSVILRRGCGLIILCIRQVHVYYAFFTYIALSERICWRPCIYVCLSIRFIR